MNPVNKLTCPACDSAKLKAIPFGNASIILGCLSCSKTWSVDFDTDDAVAVATPEPKADNPFDTLSTEDEQSLDEIPLAPEGPELDDDDELEYEQEAERHGRDDDDEEDYDDAANCERDVPGDDDGDELEGDGTGEALPEFDPDVEREAGGDDEAEDEQGREVSKESDEPDSDEPDDEEVDPDELPDAEEDFDNPNDDDDELEEDWDNDDPDLDEDDASSIDFDEQESDDPEAPESDEPAEAEEQFTPFALLPETTETKAEPEAAENDPDDEFGAEAEDGEADEENDDDEPLEGHGIWNIPEGSFHLEGAKPEGDGDGDGDDAGGIGGEAEVGDDAQPDSLAIALGILADVPADTDLNEDILPPAQNPKARESAQVETFYRRIGQVMRDNQHERWVGGKRSGRVWARDLYKVATGSSKVFARKQERKNKSYNVVILVDVSPSMRYANLGGKLVIEQAAKMCRLMVGGLSRHQLKFAVAAFGHEVTLLKGFDDLTPDLGLMADKLVEETADAMGTSTFLALAKAEEVFKQCNEGRNILLIVTDGVPSSGYTFHYDGHHVNAGTGAVTGGKPQVASKVKHIQERLADVITIGIQGDEIAEAARGVWSLESLYKREGKELETHFPDVEVTDTPEQFMRTIERRFARLITRG